MSCLERLSMAGALVCTPSSLCLCIRMPDIFMAAGNQSDRTEVPDSERSFTRYYHEEETQVIFVAAFECYILNSEKFVSITIPEIVDVLEEVLKSTIP